MKHITNLDICKLSNRVHTNMLAYGYAIVGTDWNGTVLSPVYSRLYYISSGKATIVSKENETLVLSPGRWYLLPAGFSFDFECEKEMEHYYFHLKLCDFDGTDLLRKCKKPICFEKENENIAFLSDCIYKKTTLDGMYLKQTALEVILRLLGENGIDIKADNYSPCVIKAIKYIKDNLSTRLTISEIAENIFVSKSTLTKHFKKELSMSVGEYVCDLVMSGAEYMLSATNESIQAISEKYGFCDQFYFSRKFREKFGQSPTQYRKHKLW